MMKWAMLLMVGCGGAVGAEDVAPVDAGAAVAEACCHIPGAIICQGVTWDGGDTCAVGESCWVGKAHGACQ